MKKVTLFLIFALVYSFTQAYAVTIVMDDSAPDFDDGYLNNSDTVTGGGVTVTFTNVIAGGGGDAVQVDGDGIFFGLGGLLRATSFDMTFDQNVTIDQYTIGYLQDYTGGGFTLTGSNGTSANNSMGPSIGTFTFNAGTIPVFLAAQAYGVTHDLTAGGVLSQLKSIEVTLGAPLPVELSSFHAEVTKEGINLHWETAAEINNAGFNLYKNGELVTFVNGYGTTNESHSYSYLDTNVQEGRLYTYEIEDIEEDTGVATRHPAIAVIAGKGMLQDTDTPTNYNLHEAYPNPFNPTTTVSFDLPEAANLHLSIYDATGKLVRTFADGETWNGGSYSVIWNGEDDAGNDVSSGTYFCKMVTEKYSETKAMVLLK